MLGFCSLSTWPQPALMLVRGRCGVAVFGGVLVFGDVLVFGGYCIRTQPGPTSAPFRRPKVHIGRLTCTHPLPCYHVWRTVAIFLPATSHVNARAAEVHRGHPCENPSTNCTCPKIRGGLFCPAGREGGGPRPPVAFGQFQVPLHTHRPSAPFGRSVSPKIGTPSCAELGNHGGGRGAVQDRTPNRRMRMRRQRPLLFLLLAQLCWQPPPLLAGLKRAGRPPSAPRAGCGPPLVGFQCGSEGPPPHPELAHGQCVSPSVSFKLGWKALLHTHRPGAPLR